MLHLAADAHELLLAHSYVGLPAEACGLLAGLPADGDRPAVAEVFYPCENLAASTKYYTVAPRDHLRADRDAEDRGFEIIGVVHSHTHTDPYPSPTDVAEAPDPGWHYVIVSLREAEPMVRSYRIFGADIVEEPIRITGAP
ncbi:MAG: M67 family metallopeptidase [Acidimicrobiia bacterium]|nr:M67 family metallopeptidase [Acidimicrobiia bacterium]